MAAAYVTSGTPTVGTNVTTLTISSYDASGGNVLGVGIGYSFDGDAQRVASVTFGGVSMTEHSEFTNTLEGVAMYYLENPSATPGNIVVTMSPNTTPSVVAIPFVLSGAGAPTAVATSPSGGTDGTGSTTSAATSTTDGICVDIIAIQSNQNASLAVVSGQTLRQKGITASADVTVGLSTEPGASSVVMDWTWTNTRRWAHIVAPFPASAAPPDPVVIIRGWMMG